MGKKKKAKTVKLMIAYKREIWQLQRASAPVAAHQDRGHNNRQFDIDQNAHG